MAVLVTQPDREAFLRCRQQWDFAARMRRNLEPAGAPAGPVLDRALRAALAIYYFPGMWDWDRSVTLPLVLQGLEREFSSWRERGAGGARPSAGPRQRAAGSDLLRRYFEWAPGADRFAPVLVEADFEAQVLDPVRQDAGLVGPGGQPVRYRGRIDMLAIDQYDAYWIVRHRLLTGDWPDAADLLADEAALAACWAWQQFYPGMTVAGIIHNEIHLGRAEQPPTAGAAAATGGSPRRSRWSRRRKGRELARPQQVAARQPEQVVVRQHEPSGGGRSIPQHRRMYARAREPEKPAPVEQYAGPGFRRTWLRHTQEAIAEAGRRLGADAAEMLAATGPVRPQPSDANCRPCRYLDPCLAMRAGRDSEFLVRSAFRIRPPDELVEGRLGGGSWGMGRGAAPYRRA